MTKQILIEPFLRVIALTLIIFLFNSCSDSPIEDYKTSDTINRDLFLLMDGGSNNAGIWKLNDTTLQVEDSILTTNEVPYYLSFSFNKKLGYTVLKGTFNFQKNNYLTTIDLNKYEKVQEVSIDNDFILMNDSKNSIFGFAFYSSKFTIYDPSTLLPIKSDSINYSYTYTAVTHSESKIIFNVFRNGYYNYIGLLAYDYQTQASSLIPIGDTLSDREVADIVISNDDQYAFVSFFTHNGLSGHNSFAVVDLKTKTVVKIYSCGAFAQLALSPDSKFIYLTDPAGFLRLMTPTQTILRYNIESKILEDYVNFNELSLQGSTFITEYAVVSKDSKYLFVSVNGDVVDGTGNSVSLIKLRVDTKKIEKIYSLPKNSEGHITNQITKLVLGP